MVAWVNEDWRLAMAAERTAALLVWLREARETIHKALGHETSTWMTCRDPTCLKVRRKLFARGFDDPELAAEASERRQCEEG